MSGNTLKLLMMFLMVFDHIGPFIPAKLASLFHFMTRPVSGVFAFMAVEGFIHTRDVKKYSRRLYLSGIFMEVGNRLINYFIIDNVNYYISNNIFLTLALGVTSLYLLEELKDRKALRFLTIFIVFVLGTFFSEGGLLLIPFILIIYAYRDRPRIRNIIFVFISLILGLSVWVDYGSFFSSLNMFFINSDGLIFVMALPFIYLYNGKSGSKKYSKYIFYIFYPLHLWTIAIFADKLLN